MDRHPQDISGLRQDYQHSVLDEHEVGDNPVSFFEKWFAQALEAQEIEPNAMTLSTISSDGRPKSRIVLLKGIEDSSFIFYTNYSSQKGQDLAAHPFASLVFFWKTLERQVRIEGTVSKLSKNKSEAYFHSRPTGSQLGAVASPQSHVIESRDWLEDRYQTLATSFQNQNIPMPDHWGGYALIPDRMEFWQGRTSRLHDRILCERSANSHEWIKSRLAP